MIAWTPGESTEVIREMPFESGAARLSVESSPSMLDSQVMTLTSSSPSWSAMVPWNSMASNSPKTEVSAGALIDTTGPELVCWAT